MRLLLSALVLVFAAALVAGVLRGGEPSTTDSASALLVSEVSSAPRAVPVATATPVPAPTPCPYCGQDPERWRTLTDVPPPDLLGTSAVLMEGSCGAVIFGQQMRERREPASLAKVATALVVMDHADLSDVVDVQTTGWDLAVENGSTIMGLEAGMKISVEELVYGLLLPSGNDAALSSRATWAERPASSI